MESFDTLFKSKEGQGKEMVQALRRRLTTVATITASKFWGSETAVMMTFAVVVGVGAGLGTIAFVWMIEFFRHLFFDRGQEVLGFLGRAYVILLPALGGLLVGPLVYFIAPEAKGHGVPEVLTAIITRGGRIRPVVVLAKAVGSAITIGSGGSVGREGPIVQIGSALGSTVGRLFKLNDRRVINLVAAGAAGGIAATFNAPIAGVMFALEVILGEFGVQTFSPIVISAVTASVISRIVLGNAPAFAVPAYTLVSPWELLFYLGLGGVAALGAQAFVRVLYFMEDLFDGWRFPPYWKPVVGGLAVGTLGFFLPQVFGTGFGTIETALRGQVALGLLALLVVGKILATSLTLGAGMSGGVFAPALFIGAVLGGAYGEVVHRAFPAITAASGAYAMVGMAAVFAGAARAPITAIIILFEMTQDYRIILPLMFATVVSTLVARRLEPESIYTLKLIRRGIDARARKDVNLMRTILVAEAMTPLSRLVTVRPETSLAELADLFRRTSHHGFAVTDEEGNLCGVVTLADLERALEAGQRAGTVDDICTHHVVTAFPDETLDDALRHFAALDVGRIPVVDRGQPRRLLGMLRRGDIVHAYSRALAERHERLRRIERLRLESAASAQFVEVELCAGDAAVGRRLRDIALPADCVVVSIQRGERVVVPRGHTQLLAGDRVLILAGDDAAAQVRHVLRSGRAAPPKGGPDESRSF
jgi:CIC family chloride channel protein